MSHILFINEFFHPDICASAAVATDHLPAIARLRPEWRITVIAGDRSWNDPSVVYPPSDEYRGVRIVRVARPSVSRVSLLRRAAGFAAFGRNTVRAADALGPIDLVVATTAPPQGGSIARKIARRHRCPYIYKVLDLYPDLAATLGRVKAGGFIHRRWLARDTAAMRDAALTIAISQGIADRIAETRGLPRAALRAIHDGFDPARVDTGGRDDFARQYNPAGKFVVQYAGNMGLSHPFDAIVAAARSLAGEPGIQFQFIGDGPQRGFVQANLPPNAVLLDYQPAGRLGEILAAADLCLISQHERMFDQSLPYKVYAILAAGRPSIFIGSGRSEIVAWLRESGAGAHANQGDAAALARAIADLRSQPDRLRQMGLAARDFFDRRFHVSRVAEEWTRVLEEALAGHGTIQDRHY